MCAEKCAKDWWKMSLSRAFFPATLPACSCWIREAATVHHGTKYIRTYLFRRFPALNSIHPFWPTRLWEMISAVVPLNFLFLALLRIYTYDILLHRRFLHFYDFLMIYENSSNFLLKLYDSSDFFEHSDIHVCICIFVVPRPWSCFLKIPGGNSECIKLGWNHP